MITDVFAAGTEALPAYRDAGFPDPHSFGFPTIRARGFDPVAFALLDSLLSDASFDEALSAAVQAPSQEPDLYSAPVVTTLSPRTVRILPAVPADRLITVAEDWTQFGELQAISAESVRGWLDQLQQMCKSTVSTGSLIFVWNCL